MMRASSIARTRAFLLAACYLSFGAVAATDGATPAEQAPAAQERQRQVMQPLNNAPVWNEVRTGAPQVTTVIGRETNVLIQPQGQTWRALRNGGISVFGGWALVGLLLAIAVFYGFKGTMRLHGAPTGRRLLRFTWLDRVIHWTTAITFSVLALSGLIMLFGKGVLLPVVGHVAFSYIAIVAKSLHNVLGPLFAVCLVVEFVHFVRDNFPQRGDWQWIRNFGGLLSGADTPSGRFNAGEKLWFWGGACMLGVFVCTTGFVLDFPNFDQTRSTMQIANVLHSVGALLFMMAGMAHIYMGTIGMAGAFDAMKTGYVDEEWAKEHHAYWYKEVSSAGPSDLPASQRPGARMRPP